jgi:hypothetical protein
MEPDNMSDEELIDRVLGDHHDDAFVVALVERLRAACCELQRMEQAVDLLALKVTEHDA